MKYIIKRSRQPLILVLTLLLFTASLYTASFKLASQNCLHLGQGKHPYQANKNGILQVYFQNYDVIMLQEVMKKANIGDVIQPGSHYYYIPGDIPSALKGKGSYKEAYVFIINPATIQSAVAAADYPYPGFSRPPRGVLLQTGGTYTWVVSYHAIWGNGTTDPKNEAANIGNVFNFFYSCSYNSNHYNRIIIGGDWNLNASKIQSIIGTNFHVQPTAPTSLKAKPPFTGALSQPYDHFAWLPLYLNVNNCQVIKPYKDPGGPPFPNWRTQVSDHLGVSCEVNY